MNNTPPIRKNPWIAGILSAALPGTGSGQYYNEDYAKGIMFFVAFWGSFLVWVAMVAGGRFMFMPGGFSHMPWFFYAPVHPGILGLLWVFFAIVIYLFSIFDSINTANRLNAAAAGGPYSGASGGTPQTPPAAPAPQSSGFTATGAYAASQAPRPEALQTHTEEHAESSEAKEQPDMNQDAQNATPPPRPPAGGDKKSRALTARLILGFVMLFVGGSIILDQYHVDVFEYIFNLWPLILVGLGVRLLVDFQRQKDKGQLILGAILTAVGAMFMIQIWFDINVFEAFFESIPYLLFFAGALLVLMEVVNRSRKS